MNSQTFWKCVSVSAVVGLFYLGSAIYGLSESPDFGWERQAYAQTTRFEPIVGTPSLGCQHRAVNLVPDVC